MSRLIVNPHVLRCFLRPSLTEAPSLHRHYPASSVLRASPPPHTARPVSRELPVDPYYDHRWGFPCCVWSPMRTCHRHYPGRSDGACSLVYLHRLRPSLCNSQVGSCNYFFGACSAFTHVMACTLAESPSDPLHRKLRQLRCLCRRLDCYRVERTSSRAGVAPAEAQRLFTAHCFANSSSRIVQDSLSGFVDGIADEASSCRCALDRRIPIRADELRHRSGNHLKGSEPKTLV